MSTDELEQVLRRYAVLLQAREPPPAVSAEIAVYVAELNEAMRMRADQDPLLLDPADFRSTLKSYLR